MEFMFKYAEHIFRIVNHFVYKKEEKLIAELNE